MQVALASFLHFDENQHVTGSHHEVQLTFGGPHPSPENLCTAPSVLPCN